MNIINILYLTALILLPVLIVFICYIFLFSIFKSLTVSWKKSLFLTIFLIISTAIPTLFFQSKNIFIGSILSWDIFIHPIGFILPILLCSLLYKTKEIHWKFLLLGLMPVATISYAITTPVLEKGIISPFPLWLFTPLMASVISVIYRNKLEKNTYLYAFILGVLGIIIGADLAHLPFLLQYSIYSSTQAILGGAGIFDLIFLSGLFSVLFVKLFLFLNNFDKIVETKKLIYVHM